MFKNIILKRKKQQQQLRIETQKYLGLRRARILKGEK